MAEVSLALSYPALFRVTGPLSSLVLVLVLVLHIYAVTVSSTRTSARGHVAEA
jgi:hypothetical protein